MSRHAACHVPSSKHLRIRIPVSIKPSAACHVPSSNHLRIPVSIKPSGIIVQLRKVSDDVSELQSNLAVESAARNKLEMCVEQLMTEKTLVETFQNDPTLFRLFTKILPCKSLPELDWLRDFINSRSSHWIEYIKTLGGSDFNSAIKMVFDAALSKTLQKQLSWTGVHTNKPSFKTAYKAIVDGIHVAMKENFMDYTVSKGDAKIYSLLKNAAKSAK